MKRIKSTIVFLFMVVTGFAQVQMGKIELQKKDRQAIVLYSQYSQEIVEAAIVEHMAKMGNKGKESKSLINLNKSNFHIFKGARIPGTHVDTDLYFKTERRGRKDKDESVVYLVVGKGVDEFVTTESDPTLIEKAKEMLKDFIPHLDAYKLEVDIREQEEYIKKANVKLTTLMQDSTDLVKKVEALQTKQTQNSTDQEKQRQDLEQQRQVLEALKARRKN